MSWCPGADPKDCKSSGVKKSAFAHSSKHGGKQKKTPPHISTSASSPSVGELKTKYPEASDADAFTLLSVMNRGFTESDALAALKSSCGDSALAIEQLHHSKQVASPTCTFGASPGNAMPFTFGAPPTTATPPYFGASPGTTSQSPAGTSGVMGAQAAASSPGVWGVPEWLKRGTTVDYVDTGNGFADQATVRDIHYDAPPEVYCTIHIEHEGERQASLKRLRPRGSVPPRCVQPLRRFDRSEYLDSYKRAAKPKQAYELLPKVHNLIQAFARKHWTAVSTAVSTEEAVRKRADDFFNVLQRCIDSKNGQLALPGLAATRMWSCAGVLELDQQGAPPKEYEFCGIINDTIRRDEPGSMLDWAAEIARAINLHCVQGSYTGWPDGPQAVSSWRRSDELDTTFRGGGIKRDTFAWFTPGLKFRSNQFLASSFQRRIADKFMINPNASVTMDPVLWTFRFEHEKCHHVNFLRPGHESECKELEFLLPPGSVLTVESSRWSTDVTQCPHQIVLRAAPDNLYEPEDLAFAPWG